MGSHGNYGDVGEYQLSVASYSGARIRFRSANDPARHGRIEPHRHLLDNSKLILNWIDASWETGYRIERSPNGVGNWTVLGTVGQNIPSYTDSGLTTGTRYYYRVVTLDALGDAATSAVAYGTTTGGRTPCRRWPRRPRPRPARSPGPRPCSGAGRR